MFLEGSLAVKTCTPTFSCPITITEQVPKVALVGMLLVRVWHVQKQGAIG